jgi:hypothetical protein
MSGAKIPLTKYRFELEFYSHLESIDWAEVLRGVINSEWFKEVDGSYASVKLLEQTEDVGDVV